MKQLNGRRGSLLVLAAVLAVAGWAGPLRAQESAERREHVVRKGDTLWGIAATYLKNPYLWGLLYEANRGVVEDPHWIYPSERIRIPLLPEQHPSEVAVVRKAAPAPLRRTRFYRLSGGAERAADNWTRSDAAELVAPQVEPGDYYAAPWLGEPRALPVVGRIVHIRGRENETAPSSSAHPFDAVYLQYDGEVRPAVGERLLLVRTGRGVEKLGRVIEPVAIATVTRLDAEVMTAEITRQFGRVEAGAVALPLEPLPGSAVARPVAVTDGAAGELVAFLGDQPLPGLRDRGFVDLGSAAGVRVGDEMQVYLPGRMASHGNVTLPPEPIARLRVLRVTERSATVQVIGMSQAELRPGLPVRVVARAR